MSLLLPALKVDTPTEATIRSGLYINNIVRMLNSGAGGTTSSDTASTNSGGTASDQSNYSNNADNVLASNNDRTHTQTSTVSGLKSDGGLNDLYNPLSYREGVGDTYGPAGASVATSTTTTKVGNRTVTETTEIVGDKKINKVTQETVSGGEVTEVISEERTSGTDKYGGLTKEEYYEGKTLVGLDQSTGLTLVDVSVSDAATRGFLRVQNECKESGGGRSECRKKAYEWKVENGYATKTESGRYQNTYEVGDRTRQVR